MDTEFTPLLSLAGGILIGIAALILMATNGRIAGVSGILSRLLPPAPEHSNMAGNIALVIGLLFAVPVYRIFTAAPIVQTISAGYLQLAIAGLLVGIGSLIGSGCTSGHGVCGISRLSARSIIATLTFITTGVITVTLLRHVIGG